MALTLSQATTTNAIIAARIVADRNSLASALALVQNIAADLAAIASTYGEYVTDVGTAEAANSSNAAWLAANAQIQGYVAEFTALQSLVTTATAALQATQVSL